MIVKMTGFQGKLVWQTDKPNGQPRRGLDVSRAKEFFGWGAQVPFEEGMKRTIEWFKENRDKMIVSRKLEAVRRVTSTFYLLTE